MTLPVVSPAPPDPAPATTTFAWPVPDGWTAALAVGVVHALAALLAFDPNPQSGGDNAAYRALAQALATGRGYVRLWEPGQSPETLYPPFFPFLLSLPVRLGFDGWGALNLAMVPMSVAFVVAAYLLLRRFLPAIPALACGLLVALSPGVLDLSHAVLSDLPFAVLGLLALWALHGLRAGAPAGDDDEPDADAMHPWWLTFIAVLATSLAYLTRSAALPLALAAFAWLLLRRRWLAAATLAALLVPFVVLWGRRARELGGPAYGDYLALVDPYQPSLGRMNAAQWLARTADNASHYGSRHLPVLLFGDANPVTATVAWLVLAAALAGFVLRLRRPTPSTLWLPLYVGVLLLWPATWSGERYLLPAYPVLLAYAVLGASALIRWRPWPRDARRALIGTGVVAAAAVLYADGDRAMRASDCRAVAEGRPAECEDEAWRAYFAYLHAVRGRLPSGTVIMARKPSLVYSESGYASVTYPFSSVPDTLFRGARQAGARYLLLDDFPLAERFVYPVVREHPGRFCAMPGLPDSGAVLLRIEDVPIAGAATSGELVRLKGCTL